MSATDHAHESHGHEAHTHNPPPAPATDDPEMAGGLGVTETAAAKIREIRESEAIEGGYALRVKVMGGGCSGFQYALDFEQEARETDESFEVDGLKVFVDPVSARYLEDVVIDYVFGMNGAGFKFNNPKATGTCGCGSSFAV